MENTDSSMLRIQNLSASKDVLNGLLDLGFSSSYAIYQAGEKEFVGNTKDLMGEDSAREAFAMARHNYILTQNLIIALQTACGSDYYRALSHESADNERIKSIPSYQKIFGELEYCGCEHCKSIFGAAAYFVDLLRIVSTPKYFVFGENAVKFQVRRADLLNLQLTCENTNELVSYLQIVNNVLEQYITITEKSDNPFKKLASERHPHNLPFVLPASQVEIAVKLRTDCELITLMSVLCAEPRHVARNFLGITAELYTELTKPIPSANLHKYYGVNPAGLSDAESFLRATGLDIGGLYNLIYQGISEDDTKALSSLFINKGQPAGKLLAIYEEGGAVKIKNLNDGGLERIYRFIKLGKSLGLGFAQTELVLKTVCGGMSDINESSLLMSARLLKFSRDNAFDIAKLTALMGASAEPAGDSPTLQSIALEFDKSIDEVKALAAAVVKYSGQLPKETAEILCRHLILCDMTELSVEEYLEYIKSMGLVGAKRFSLAEIEGLTDILANNTIDINDCAFFMRDYSPPEALMAFVRDLHLPAENNETNRDFIKSYLLEELSAYLEAEPDDLFALTGCAAPQNQEAQWLTELFTDSDEALGKKLDQLLRWHTLHKNGIFPPVLKTLAKNPSAFGTGKIDIHALTRVSSVNALIKAFGDRDFTLADFLNAKTPDEKLSVIAALTQWDIKQVQALKKRVFSESLSRAELLLAICRAFFLLQKANLDMELAEHLLEFSELKESSYDSLTEKAAFHLAALGSRDVLYATEGAKRDALLSRALFLLSERMENVKTAEDLYKHFLIDAQMDDKTEISYIKEGINAVQLYLQRCKMGLEEGVLALNIHENWWSWLLNYRMWEANRKIFVYPENYLLPPLRSTKSSLFNRLMENLNQSRPDLGAVEGEYITYLEDYEKLTRLTVCSSYAARINEQDTLFLFARTRIKPYKYYYCKQTDNIAWTEWNEIDAAIESDEITPVYVFDRLHIFWSDVSTIDKGGVNNKEGNEQILTIRSKVVSTARMKYTYLNLRGKWILPQTLVEDEIAYYHDNKESLPADRGDPSLTAAFTADGAHWKKPMLIRIRRRNVQGFVDVPADYERFAVLIGPRVASLPKKLKPYDIKPADDPDKKAFLKKLNQLIDQNNFLFDSAKGGYLCAGMARIYGPGMEEAHISHDTEFALLESYSPYTEDGNIAFRAARDKVHKIIGAVYTGDILSSGLSADNDILYRSNYGSPVEAKVKLTANDFPHGDIFGLLKTAGLIINDYAVAENMLKTDISVTLKSLIGKIGVNKYPGVVGACKDILLRNAGVLYTFTYPFDGGVISVNNRPGWFIFDCRDEAFLVYPTEEVKGNSESPVVFTALDDGLRAGDPPLTAAFLMQRGFFETPALNVIKLLKQAGLLDGSSVPIRIKCSKEAVCKALDSDPTIKILDYEKAKAYAFIHNFPKVSEILFNDLFEPGSEMPGKIFKSFKEKQVILSTSSPEELPDYRLDLCMYKTPPDITLEFGEETAKAIYAKLSALPVSVSLQYEDTQTVHKPFTDRKFAVCRLTNNSIGKMQSRLLRGGIREFLTLDAQKPPKEPVLPFSRLNPNKANLVAPKASDGAQIDFESLYGEYNWELFYHIPMAMAANFISASDLDAASQWFHYVFNPMKNKNEDKFYWNFMPFLSDADEKLIDILRNPGALVVYNNHPFNPHAIARLRIGAYEKYTVIEYIANIIRAGDGCFIQNTWEGINTATMMYVLASDLLGKRPVEKKLRKQTAPKTFAEIFEEYGGDVPQIIIEVENFIQKHGLYAGSLLCNEDVPMNGLDVYFQIPENEQLIKCWDLVEDRLFKVRNSLDINGNPRVMQLFEAPVDPLGAISSFAAQAGSSGAIVLEGVKFPYRFQHVAERAKSVTAQLISLSAALLSAAEKKDAESLLKISKTQEKTILDMTTSVRHYQIDEIGESIEALNRLRASAEDRKAYYEGLSKEYISEKERTSLDAAASAFAMATAAGIVRTAAGVAHLLPQVGSPFAMTYGGVQVGNALSSAASVIELGASISSYISQRSLTMAGYDRRRDDWSLQARVSKAESENLQKQIDSAKIRKKIAENELAIHKRSIEHNKQVMEHIGGKFSKEELYQWLMGKISATMWQTYQLALSLSLATEKAYQFERDLPNESFIRFDYWDSGKKGLFAGEALMLSLEQLETAYIKGNVRRLEIEKNVSLAVNCPEAFLKLKATGACDFELPEILFALDYPGLYCRKIKSVSISIPAVMPPYQTFKAILRQNESKVLLKPDTDGADYLLGFSKEQPEAGVLAIVCDKNSRIAISGGIDDSGMFRLNFDDERYLPFEGCGALSSWSLSMPKENNLFDFDAVSDVIINIKYTALEDGVYGAHVTKRLNALPYPGGLHYRLRYAYPAQWQKFAAGGSAPVLSFTLPALPLAYFRDVRLAGILFKIDAGFEINKSDKFMTLNFPGSREPVTLDFDRQMGVASFKNPCKPIAGNWEIALDLKGQSAESIDDIEMILIYHGTL